jgi:hypothetical protein
LGWPWSYWPSLWGYDDYPYYPTCDPYSPYPCGPYGYGAYSDPYSYDPYISDPGAPPDPQPSYGARTSYPAADPPSAPLAIADGRWHRFGAGVQAAAPARPAATPVRSTRSTSPPAANVADGKWHAFGARRDTVATASSRTTASPAVLRAASK